MTQFQPIKRRTFLRAAGTSLALPLLEGMLPRTALATAPATAAGMQTPPVRLAWVFFPNGTNYRRWAPEGEGVNWKPSPTLEPLAGVKDKVLLLSGLTLNGARSLGDGPGDHARSGAAFLTGMHPNKTAGAGVRAGVSVDQVVAGAIGRNNPLPSLELGVERGRSAGDCDSGYSCAYSNNISWRSPTQPTAKEINPRLAFERLFGGRHQDRTEQAERIARRRSILDLVADQSRSLQQRLGGEDRRKLDEYFQSVREVESRIEHLAAQGSSVGESPFLDGVEPPAGKPDDLTAHIRLMYDLMLLAFRTDSTRVATFMLANEGSNRRYPMIDVNDGHHELSHHQNKEHKQEQIARIDRYLVEQYAYFVQRLSETPEGEGTLLDNCAVLYGGAISDGNRHSHHDLPIVVAGRGGGVFTPGRHVKYATDTPLCNLYLSMLDAVGAPEERFGDSTGRLDGLTV